MNKADKIFFYLLLLVPFISSILSTIHIIDLVSFGNVATMALAVAITFEVSSVISFAATGNSVLKHVKKGWLFFIFGMLFVLQAVGNVYSGFAYMNLNLFNDPYYLSNFMEMTFNFWTLTEAKLVLATLIGLPLPIISLVMLKFAIDKASVSAFMEGKSEPEPNVTPESTQDSDVESIMDLQGGIIEDPVEPSIGQNLDKVDVEEIKIVETPKDEVKETPKDEVKETPKESGINNIKRGHKVAPYKKKPQKEYSDKYPEENRY